MALTNKGIAVLRLAQNAVDLNKRKRELKEEFSELENAINSNAGFLHAREGNLTGDSFLDAAICLAIDRRGIVRLSKDSIPKVLDAYNQIVDEKQRIESSKGLFIYDTTRLSQPFYGGTRILFGRLDNPQLNVVFRSKDQIEEDFKDPLLEGTQSDLDNACYYPKIFVEGYKVFNYFKGHKGEFIKASHGGCEILDSFEGPLDLVNWSDRGEYLNSAVTAKELSGFYAGDQVRAYLSKLKQFVDSRPTYLRTTGEYFHHSRDVMNLAHEKNLLTTDRDTVRDYELVKLEANHGIALRDMHEELSERINNIN